MNRLKTSAVLAAAGLAALASGAAAQERKPWVDPPKVLRPAQPPAVDETPREPPIDEAPAPAAAAPAVAPRAVAPAAARQVARKREPAPRKRVAAPAPAQVRPVERRLAARPPAQERRARIAREGVRDGLEVMMLQTIELPTGETVTVLADPDPATMRRIMRGRIVR